MKGYALRWNIETLFGILITRGFCLEATHLTEQERLRKLLVLLTLVLCWSMQTGYGCTSSSPCLSKPTVVEPKAFFG